MDIIKNREVRAAVRKMNSLDANLRAEGMVALIEMYRCGNLEAATEVALLGEPAASIAKMPITEQVRLLKLAARSGNPTALLELFHRPLGVPDVDILELAYALGSQSAGAQEIIDRLSPGSVSQGKLRE